MKKVFILVILLISCNQSKINEEKFNFPTKMSVLTNNELRVLKEKKFILVENQGNNFLLKIGDTLTFHDDSKIKVNNSLNLGFWNKNRVLKLNSEIENAYVYSVTKYGLIIHSEKTINDSLVISNNLMLKTQLNIKNNINDFD